MQMRILLTQTHYGHFTVAKLTDLATTCTSCLFVDLHAHISRAGKTNFKFPEQLAAILEELQRSKIYDKLPRSNLQEKEYVKEGIRHLSTNAMHHGYASK